MKKDDLTFYNESHWESVAISKKNISRTVAVVFQFHGQQYIMCLRLTGHQSVSKAEVGGICQRSYSKNNKG